MLKQGDRTWQRVDEYENAIINVWLTDERSAAAQFYSRCQPGEQSFNTPFCQRQATSEPG